MATGPPADTGTLLRDRAGAASRSRPIAFHPPAIGAITAAVGALVFLFGILSALYVEPTIYRDALTGYDPPFDAVAGLLLLALSFRIRERTTVAWLFSLFAPLLTLSIAALSPNVYSILSAAASTLLVAMIYPYRVGFYRGSAAGPEATQMLVVVAALLSILFGMVGARFLATEFSPPIQGWNEALYFTVATISTNGANYLPLTNTARLFAVLLILFGVGTFLTAVVVLFVPFLERRLQSLAARLERAQMEELRDHVIVCGTSGEARASVDALREAGSRTILLSTDPKTIEVLRAEGYRTHLGDPSSEETLRGAGIDRARALVAAMDSDAENLLTVITARGIRPNLRIIALAKQADTLPKLEKAGANQAISLVRVAGRLVSAAALEASGGAPVG